MTSHSETIHLQTPGRAIVDITEEVRRVVSDSGVTQGLCNIFIHHTSASLLINENADPDVRRDLEAFMHRLVPDGDSLFVHTAEGPDDMPAHVRSVLTATSLTIPINGSQLALGTWQGLFVWEHRSRSHRRRLTITAMD